MTFFQLIGLNCRHRNLGVPMHSPLCCSVPTHSQQCCLDCGERVDFVGYMLSEADKQPVAHVKLVVSSVRRVQKTLRWRRKA